jgi:hypothetical protein
MTDKGTSTMANENLLAKLLEEDIISSVGQLKLWETRVEPDMKIDELERQFVQEPALPGVLVTGKDSSTGILSRGVFLSLLSHQLGRELYKKRQVKDLLQFIDQTPLTLSADMSISEALTLALARRDVSWFDPVLVTSDNITGLLEIQILVAAQGTLLEDALASHARLISKLKAIFKGQSFG